jgi:hypothetical protein
LTSVDLESRSRSTKSFSAKKHCPSNFSVKLRLNLLGSSFGIALTRSYAEKYVNDPFLTLKVGQGQPKAFQRRSMDQGTLLPNFINPISSFSGIALTRQNASSTHYSHYNVMYELIILNCSPTTSTSICNVKWCVHKQCFYVWVRGLVVSVFDS